MNHPLLELKNVNSGYGESQVLFDVSMDVKDNQVVALLGRNGAGKTTTLKSIMGIQPPFSGSIQFDGKEIGGASPHEIAKKGIGYVPEERRVFDTLTVEEHFLIGTNKSNQSKKDELEFIYDIFPELDKYSHLTANKLSGGQQQMLAIGRGLVGPTNLLLLDEPSEGLAPKIVQTVVESIDRLKEETAILLVEQNYPMARRLADCYFILDQGEVVSKGDMEKLDNDQSLRDKYLGIE
jgi:branched-chain amino acid transport system ATP-binding protein